MLRKLSLPPADNAKHIPTNGLAGQTPDSIFDFSFVLPPALEAGEPPEARGLARDEVRLLVSYRADNRVAHARFRDLPSFLRAGDLLVINTSGTMNAALPASRADGQEVELHLSTHLPGDLWVVEVRQLGLNGTSPFFDAVAGETLALPEGAAILHAPYVPDPQAPTSAAHSSFVLMPSRAHARLWVATLRLPGPLADYLERYGFPIRYSYVKEAWPSSYYQSVYATIVGSAEMPSAGRAFTPELITRLIAQGVIIAPLLLHTGVASLEGHEPPYEEYYEVPLSTSRLVNIAREAGQRIVAVGTTVVRALETVTDSSGTTHPGRGWADVIVTPERGLHSFNALLTGFHEPHATHLAMLEALAGRDHLRFMYAAALDQGYLWHEFGDLHLILP
jgi:S-adenosylmethionine:tRNA ribosyltransferase-isomerase